MVRVKRIVLDVLKPHQPDALAFSRALASSSLRLQISGDSIDLAPIEEKIASLGASIHSIDQVVVLNEDGEG